MSSESVPPVKVGIQLWSPEILEPRRTRSVGCAGTTGHANGFLGSHPRPSSSGFTLLEVLLALSMMAILFALVYGIFGTSSDLLEAAEQESESYHMARLSFRQLSQELTSVVQSLHGVTFRETSEAGCPQIARVELLESVQQGGEGSVAFIGVDADQGARPADCLMFATYAHGRYRPDAKESDLSVVTYWLEGDKVMHDEETNVFSLSSKSVESFPLAESVAGLNFTFYDGTQWLDEWDAAKKGGLPKALEVELTFLLPSEERRVFRTTVALPPT